MPGSAIPAATDWIVSLAQAAAAGRTVDGQSVTVSDGYPLTPSKGIFVVGLDQPPDDAQAATTGTRSWGPLGARPVEENFSIPCYIACWCGTTYQKSMRDAAFEIFDDFFFRLWSDLTLGGALTNGPNCQVVDLTAAPTAVTASAKQGRQQLITFSVQCHSRYTPTQES